MRSRSTKYVLGVISLLVFMLLIGSATAETIIGNAAGESHERVVTLPNSVLIEKFVHHELANGAKITDSASGPLSATNTDPTNGEIEVDLDAYNIDVSGKVSGTGTAILEAHVLAEGFVDPVTGFSSVNTNVLSIVDLNSGAKGKAEGKVSASGEASAELEMPLGTVLTAAVDGSTSASGKVTSGSESDLFAIGVIDADSFADPVNGYIDAEAEIEAEVEGENKAEGTATADGFADADVSLADPLGLTEMNLDATADAATSASGKGSGAGEFEVEAEVSSHSAAQVIGVTALVPLGYSVYSEVEAEAWSEGDKTYSASTFASATTGTEENDASIEFNDIELEFELADVSTSGTATAGTTQKGAGEMWAESEIEAEYETPGEFDWEELLVLDDIAGIGFADVPALEAGYSAVWSWAGTEGSGSAVATADGEAEQFGTPLIGILDGTGQTVETEASGETGASAKSTGTGTAESWATIGSEGLVASIGGQFVYFFDIGLPETSIDVPEMPELPETPELDELLANDQLFNNEMLTGTDNFATLQNSEEFRGMLDALRGEIPSEIALPEELGGEGAIDLPPIMTTSLSIIESGASASGATKKDSASASSFVKDGATESFAQLRDPTLGIAKSFTSSEGSTATSASANEVTDPASEAAITSISVQGIGGVSGLDASLIGSISVAEGAKGTSSGRADGETAADGAFVVLAAEAAGPTKADGVVHTTATANNGVSVAAATLASADFETVPITPVGVFVGNIIDISVLGSAAGTIGTGSAAADASGTTEASGQLVALNPDPVFVNSLSNATGSSSVKVNVQNGIAAAVDGLVAGEFVGVVTTSDPETGDVLVTTSEITGGSLIGEVVFAERFDGKGFAKAEAAASGTAKTNGSFNVTNGIDPLTEETRFFTGEALTEAKGSVAGKADVSKGDPLTTSLIVAFTDVDGFNVPGSDGTAEVIDGDVYGAGLVAGVSVADGTVASTSGSANGAASVDASLDVIKGIEVAGEESEDIGFGTLVIADGAVTTNAVAKGGLAASVAAEGASGSIEFVDILDTGFTADQSDIALMLTGSTAFGTSSSGATATADIVEAGSGVSITDFDLDDETEEVVSDDQAFMDVWATVDEGAAASSSALATQGFALGVSGIGSGVFTDFVSTEQTDDLAPTADITSVSLLIGGAAGASDSTKGVAKASATASGATDGDAFLVDPLGIAEQHTDAEGIVDVMADTKAKSDPVSIAAIVSFSDLEAGPDSADVDEGTFIGSASFTAGDRSSTSGSADGTATAEGEWLWRMDDESEDPDMIVGSDSTTTADVTSSAASTKGGVGLSAAGVGSIADAHSDAAIAFTEGDNIEFAFAGAEGANKMSTATAASGYESAESTATGSVFFMDLETPQEFSTSDVSGDGSASVKVSGANMAKGLAFAAAESDAMFDGATTFSGSEVAFGTQAMASDNAPVEAHVAMEDTGVHAFSATETGVLDPTFATLGYADGVSYIDLLPKKNTLVWDTYAIGDPNPQVSIGGAAITGDDKEYSLIADPNFAVWTKAGIAVSDPLALPPAPPDFFILPNLPPF